MFISNTLKVPEVWIFHLLSLSPSLIAQHETAQILLLDHVSHTIFASDILKTRFKESCPLWQFVCPYICCNSFPTSRLSRMGVFAMTVFLLAENWRSPCPYEGQERWQRGWRGHKAYGPCRQTGLNPNPSSTAYKPGNCLPLSWSSPNKVLFLLHLGVKQSQQFLPQQLEHVTH